MYSGGALDGSASTVVLENDEALAIGATTQRGPEAETKRGRKAAQGFVKDYVDMFDDVAFEPEEVP